MNYLINSIIYYIKFTFPYILIVLPIYFLIRFIYINKKNIKFNIKKELILLIFIIYLTSLLSLTIIPRITNNKGINIIPFKIVYDSIIELKNGNISYLIISFIGNIIIFIPYGLLLKTIYKLNDKKTILIGFLTTFLIEFIQIFQDRWVDIDDIILNTLGVLIGIFIFRKLIDKNKN